jgi:hypothetical protein
MASPTPSTSAVGVLDYLDLDSAVMWDPACPVLLPLGPITIAPIMSASMGVLVPFILFVLAQFAFLYRMWDANARDDPSSSAMDDAEADAPQAHARKRVSRGMGGHAHNARHKHRQPHNLNDTVTQILPYAYVGNGSKEAYGGPLGA